MTETRSPLFQQIHDDLKSDILAGEYPHGLFLPSEKELGTKYHASRITVRAALKLLDEAGLTIAIPKRGRRVNCPTATATRGDVPPMIFLGPTTEYTGQIYQGCLDALRPQGVECTFMPTSGNTMSLADGYLATIEAEASKFGKAGGIMFFCASSDVATVHTKLESLEKPYVGVGYSRTSPFPTVCSDDYGNTQHLVDYLLNKGHRKIAFLYWERHHLDPAFTKRIAAYEQAMINAGLPPNTVRMPREVYLQMPDFHNVASELLDLHSDDHPTCIIASTNLLIPAVTRAAMHSGLEVPNDICFCGFGHGKEAVEQGLPFNDITSMESDWTNIGRTAARLLLSHHYQLGLDNNQTLIPGILIEGDSLVERLP